jgi:hypothetical protein
VEVTADSQELERDDDLVVIHLWLDEAPPPGTDRVACRTPVPCGAGDRVVCDLTWPGMPSTALAAAATGIGPARLGHPARVTHALLPAGTGLPVGIFPGAGGEWVPAASPPASVVEQMTITRQPVLVWLRETMAAMEATPGITQAQRDEVYNRLAWGRPEGDGG